MAFYVLVRKILCYKVKGYIDQIEEYKKYLHEQWLNSLSEDEHREYLALEEKKRREAIDCITTMIAFNNAYGRYLI